MATFIRRKGVYGPVQRPTVNETPDEKAKRVSKSKKDSKLNKPEDNKPE